MAFHQDIKKWFCAALLCAALGACAAPQAGNGNYAENDPLEPLNRGIYRFNEVVDGVVVEPAARVYRAAAPQPVRHRVSNFLQNLTEPVNVVNAVLQGDARHAFTSFWRFVLNTTFGLGGANDFAGQYAGLEYRKEDFGQTLGAWGVSSGPYLVLPLVGPSSFRDAPGRVVDYVTDPFNYALKDGEIYGRKGAELVTAREAYLDVLDEINETSFDPYATIRSGYTQRRADEVRNGRVRVEYYY